MFENFRPIQRKKCSNLSEKIILVEFMMGVVDWVRYCAWHSSAHLFSAHLEQRKIKIRSEIKKTLIVKHTTKCI